MSYLKFFCLFFVLLTIMVGGASAASNVSSSSVAVAAGESVRFTVALEENMSKPLYTWTFGDNTGKITSKSYLSHTFVAAGNYTINVSIEDDAQEPYYNGSVNVSCTQLVYTLPEAKINVSSYNGSAPLKVKFTDSSTNATSRYWDFGDGYYSSNCCPSHTYKVVDNYSVSLTVENAYGDKDIDTCVIVVEPVLNNTIPENNTSSSTNNSTSNSTNSTVNETNITNNITQNNTQVNTTENNTTVLKINDFTISAVSGVCPLKTNSVCNVSGNPVSYLWAWTDANGTPIDSCDWYSKHNVSAVHTFKKPGLYTMTLVVKDAQGNTATLVKKDYINVTEKQCIKPVVQDKCNKTDTSIVKKDKCASKGGKSNAVSSGDKPYIVFTSDKITSKVGEKVIFAAKVSGNPTKWVWDFGDNVTSASGNGAGHTYTQPGNYTVSVKVTNAYGTTTIICENLIHVNGC